MEQRQEIKDGVKQRLIEFMAEQITKEESFSSLKNELIQELLVSKEIKTPVVNELSKTDLGVKTATTFEAVAITAQSALDKIKEKQAERFKKILDVKLGRDSNINIIKAIKAIKEEGSESYSDTIEMLENKNIPDYKESFLDPLLKRDFTEEDKKGYRESTLNVLMKILDNPISKDLDVFSVTSQASGDNYMKSYKVQNKLENFTFECIYHYNSSTGKKLITELYADSKGFKLFGDELGIPFAIQAMEIIEQAEATRQEAVKFVESKNKRKTRARKKK